MLRDPIISLSKYQEFVAAGYAGRNDSHNARIINGVFGLVGETGEVVDIVKKNFFDRDGALPESQRDHFIEEMGDVLWYLTELAVVYHVDIEDVMLQNLRKLCTRYPESSKKWLSSLSNMQRRYLGL